MRIRTLYAAVLAALLVAVMTAPATAQQPTPAPPPAPAQVTVVHAFRGLVADVYLDGQRQLEGFSPERLAGPLPVPAGAHEVAVYEAGQGPPSTPVLSETVELEPGTNVSAVVHPGAEGEARLSVYTNDTSPLASGTSRLVVRHAAGFGPLQVLLDGVSLGGEVESGDEAAQQLPAGGHQTAVVAAGEPVLTPVEVTAAEGEGTILYLIGSGESLGWLSQTVEGMETTPAGVPTGTSGLAATPPDSTPRTVAVAAMVVLAAGLGSVGVWRARTRPVGR